MSSKSIIVLLNEKDWKISNQDLMDSASKFLSIYGKQDFEYSKMASNESLISWTSDDNRVTVDRYQAEKVYLLRSADGDAKSRTEISVDGEIVFSGSEYMNPLIATGNKDYLKEMVDVPKDTVWLLAMYQHDRAKRLNRDASQDRVVGM